MPKKGERPRFKRVLAEHGYENFDQFLREAEENNWHPAEMARRLNVTQHTMAQWLSDYACEKRVVYRRVAA